MPGADTGLMIKRTIRTKEGECVEYRIDNVMIRELTRLEDAIAKELGQDGPPPEPKEEEKTPDMTCLTHDEFTVLEIIHNKIAYFNPWMTPPSTTRSLPTKSKKANAS